MDATGKPVNLHDYRTFFPSAIDQASAQTVHGAAGEEQLGIDIHVQRGPLLSIAGKISDLAEHSAAYRVSASFDIGLGWSGKDVALASDRSFLIADLAPGKHKVILLEQSANGLRTVGSTEVNLTDRNLTDVRMMQPQGAALELHENEHATLHLKLLTREVTDPVRQRLGL